MSTLLSLPNWATELESQLPESIGNAAERMRVVIKFACLNVQQGTGGPFAAGVFETQTGRLVAIGVNQVVRLECSSAHAEIVALSRAQKKLGSFDLGAKGMPQHQLVVNGQPCAMCYGSIPWSGVRSVVCGASGEQIEKITGFDEGPIHPNWRQELESRGIQVEEGVLADDACQALTEFVRAGHRVYNGRGG